MSDTDPNDLAVYRDDDTASAFKEYIRQQQEESDDE